MLVNFRDKDVMTLTEACEADDGAVFHKSLWD